MQRSFILTLISSREAWSLLFSRASHIKSTIFIASTSLNPLVVISGVPILIPDVTKGDSGSLGIEFLLDTQCKCDYFVLACRTLSS